jgi:UDP-N-acetylglucosamine--dolichyl-phosphate N-acetylglucosaminephosphotransferase
MLDALEVAELLAVFAVTFVVAFVATPILGRILKKRGIVGKDVHKLSKTEIPEMCGLAILLALSVGVVTTILLFPDRAMQTISFIGTILIAGVIGVRDDLRPLGPKLKPLLTMAACVPILLLQTYDPIPTIPLVGPVRLTIVYPLLIPIALAVTSNAMNMMDVLNGAMPGTVSVICLATTVILLVADKPEIAALSTALLASMLAFYYFNRFPAKVFDGDTGSLAVGAAIGALAVLGRIEAVMVVALIPHIMNAFSGLSSIGRLYERREIRQRPTRLLKDGRLEANTDRNAPVTLTRLILTAGPLGEKEIVRNMILLTCVSSFLAVLTYVIMVGGRT